MSRTTVGAAVRVAASRLRAAGIDGGARDARLMMAHALGIAPGRLSLCESDLETRDASETFGAMLRQRLERHPLSHILGRRAFYEHEFIVTPDVLDPRPETEALVGAALACDFTSVLDLGTGSGAILLSLLAARAGAQGMGTDVSRAALEVAARNAAAMGVAGRARLLLSDWFGAVEGHFDLIVSNPPYIAVEEMAGLAPELRFEPRMALTDGGDGLACYRTICAGARTHLVRGGWLMMEIGWRQSAAVSRMMTNAGFERLRILPDLDGRDRVIMGRAPVATPAGRVFVPKND